MKIVITGGAGFIGRSLVEQSLASGHEVTVVDSLVRGRLEHLEPFRDLIAFDRADVLDATRINQIFTDVRPECVLHLAAHHFIPFCNEHPEETIRTNVEGSLVVLTAAAAAGARRAVVASTGAIYPSLDDPLIEDREPVPTDIYGLSKYLMEGVAEFIARTTPLACTVARLFNTYGPWETNPHLIPEIIDNLRRSTVLPLGNVTTKRDYIYVDDVARILLRCAAMSAPGLTVVNVGTGDEFSAEEIVRTLGELLGMEITIEVDPTRLRRIDKANQRADVARMRCLPGEGRPRSLRQGLRDLLIHEGFLT